MSPAYQSLDRLTPRERQVLRYVSQGHSSVVIGRKMHISMETVKSHRKNILRKMECQSMTQAVAKSLITDDPDISMQGTISLVVVKSLLEELMTKLEQLSNDALEEH